VKKKGRTIKNRKGGKVIKKLKHIKGDNGQIKRKKKLIVKID
jgi:hypothetical protein